MKFQLGQRWTTRNGRTVQIVAIGDHGITIRFVHQGEPGGRRAYLRDNGRMYMSVEGPWDLIRLIGVREAAE